MQMTMFDSSKTSSQPQETEPAVELSWKDKAHTRVIRRYVKGELALNHAKAIAQFPHDIQLEVLAERNIPNAIRKAKTKVKRIALRAELDKLVRPEAELKLEADAIGAWESNLGWDFESLKKENLDRLKPKTIKALTAKREWVLSTLSAERMAWIKSSHAKAGEVQAQSDRKQAQDERERGQRYKNFNFRMFFGEVGINAIFSKLPPRLQKRFMRDSIKRYHPDKLTGVTDSQELEDCKEIVRVLLEINESLSF